MICDKCYYLVVRIKSSHTGLPQSLSRVCMCDNNRYVYDLDEEVKPYQKCDHYEEGSEWGLCGDAYTFAVVQVD